jgi:hypothetical protein
MSWNLKRLWPFRTASEGAIGHQYRHSECPPAPEDSSQRLSPIGDTLAVVTPDASLCFVAPQQQKRSAVKASADALCCLVSEQQPIPDVGIDSTDANGARQEPGQQRADDNTLSSVDNHQMTTWSTFEELFGHFKDKADKNGFMIGRNTKLLTESQFSDLFPDESFRRVVSRGFLYCIRGGSVQKENGVCCWRIQFRIDFELRRYVLQENLTNQTHSHSIVSNDTRASTRRLISYEREMLLDEHRYCMQFGAASLGVMKVRELMRLRFPDRDYDGQLLSRVLKKAHDLHFGSDQDGMSSFLELGQELRKTGGIFDFSLSIDGRISEVFVMKTSMLPYAKVYSDFVINDGSHNMDMYGTITMPNTLVDCLGKSVIVAYSQYRSEHSGHLMKALTKFGLDSSGSTLMTDDGPAYHIVAANLQMKHVLCVKHYQDLIFASRAGLAHLANDFTVSANRALFHDFGTSQDLQTYLHACFAKFGHVSGARKFLEAVSSDQKLVCRTHTSSIFTASAVSTQRGESSNSRLKGNGDKKAELRKFSLFKLLRWYLDLVELQEEKTLRMIIKLLTKNRQWSVYVQKTWQSQSLLVSNRFLDSIRSITID